MSNTFQCDLCEGTFTKGRSDEEAIAECVALRGEGPDDDSAILCEPCLVEHIRQVTESLIDVRDPRHELAKQVIAMTHPNILAQAWAASS